MYMYSFLYLHNKKHSPISPFIGRQIESTSLRYKSRQFTGDMKMLIYTAKLKATSMTNTDNSTK